MNEENIVRSPFPSINVLNLCVGEYLHNKVKKLENSTVIIESKTGKTITANELISKAKKLAIALINRGITKSDIVCGFGNNCINYAILKFAVHFLGVTATQSPPTNNIYEFHKQIKDCGANVIFISASKIPIMEKLVKETDIKPIKLVVVFDQNDSNYLSFNTLISEANGEELTTIPYFNVNPKEDIAVIAYTSGTSGVKKGALISHFAFVNGLEIFPDINKNHNIGSVISCHQPFGHISGTYYTPACISRALTVVIHESVDEEIILRSVEIYKINILTLFPALGYKLGDKRIAEKYDLSSVKMLIQGGTHLSSSPANAILDKHNLKLIVFYALTEYIRVTQNEDFDYIHGNCGQLAPNVELKITDLSIEKNLRANKCGEICIRGPSMFSGYLNNESATNDTIDSNGWLRTGDVGYYDECGRLFIVDRIKEIIKYRLSQVSPADIEEYLMQHNAVEEVIVVGVPHKTDTQWPRAYIKLKAGVRVTAEELESFAKMNMAEHNRIRGGVVFVDDIPKTLIGKKDRKFFKDLVSHELMV